MAQRTVITLLLAVALVACGGEGQESTADAGEDEQAAQESERADPTQEAPETERVNLEAVQKEVSEAMDVLGDYTLQQRDQARQRAEAMVADLDANIEQLREKLMSRSSDLSAATRIRLEKTIDTLEAQREGVKQALADLGEDTSRAWIDVKTGFVESYAAMKSALHTARREYMDDDPSTESAASDQVIDVVTREYTIEMTDTMKLGWNTFRFSNEGNQTHFVLMYRLVEGKDIEDQRAAVVPAFDAVMEGLRNGDLTKEDIGPFLTEHIPEWGLQMTYVGGAGLLAPGMETQSTFNLETPGIHLVECYVKAPDGTWHTSMGMLHQVKVLDETGNAEEPTADFEVSIGNDGVTAPATAPAGQHTIRVNMVDDPPTFQPYDLNLARISDDTDLEEVVFWMDWSNVGGLRAPAPVQFIGGVEHMNAGKHGFMTVNLEPGKYLWISEINAGAMHATFEVE